MSASARSDKFFLLFFPYEEEEEVTHLIEKTAKSVVCSLLANYRSQVGCCFCCCCVIVSGAKAPKAA